MRDDREAREFLLPAAKLRSREVAVDSPLHEGGTLPDGTPSEILNLLVCADLSQHSQEFGVSVDPFPGRYR